MKWLRSLRDQWRLGCWFWRQIQDFAKRGPGTYELSFTIRVWKDGGIE